MHCHSNILIQTQGNLCSLKYTVVFFFPLSLREPASAYSLTECHSNNINTNSRYFFFGGRKNKCFQEKCVGLEKAERDVCDQTGPDVTSSQLYIYSLRACSDKVWCTPSSYRCQQRTALAGRAGSEPQLSARSVQRLGFLSAWSLDISALF